MIKLPPITWTYEGRELSVSLFVEGDAVVGMTPVDGAQALSRIQVATPADEKQYLGDHVANGLSKLGVKPCSGCNKRKQLLNSAHKKVAQLIG